MKAVHPTIQINSSRQTATAAARAPDDMDLTINSVVAVSAQQAGSTHRQDSLNTVHSAQQEAVQQVPTTMADYVQSKKLCTVMIGCVEFNERHTSINLKNFLETKFVEWNISQYGNVIVSDNAANILSAVRLGGWHSLPRYAHTINLVVQSSLDAISDTKRRVKDIIEYFHRSGPAKKK